MSMKSVINWSYERASWQWDVLCVLILVFIFATPKEWFNKATPLATQTAAVVVQSDDCGCDVHQ
ncbi:MAG: hypothetical protein ACKVQJ_02745 [Pyrinomonadaceae bacterium]